ncbi:MAG: hypothetical protein MK089_04800, partial [Phycisphaerales bacterium]|nr:hypothetical protein [Phycisphaerales bacterium]
MSNRSLVVQGGSVSLEARPSLQPVSGQVVVQVSRVGLSHLDAAIGQGRMEFEGVPGQEIVGKV